MSISLDVWYLVAQHCEPNPSWYTAWAQVCRNSRAAFYDDRIWAKLTPVDRPDGPLALAWHSRVTQWPESIRKLYRDVWVEVYDCWHDRCKLEVDWIETRVAIFKGALIDSQFFHDPDFALAAMVWMHIHCPVWVPCEIRNSEHHGKFVKEKNPTRTEAFQRAMVRLYGPLLRYCDEHLFDDKQLALEAAAYSLGQANSNLEMEWVQWHEIPPFYKLSSRLRADADVQRAGSCAMTKLDPVAGYVVKTTTLVGAAQKIFINLCVDPQIPTPETTDLTEITARVMQGQDWVVPIIVSPQRKVTDKAGKEALVFDCCMNPKVLLLGAQDPGIKVLVNETSIELVEDSTGLALDRNYSLPKMKAKGELFATEFSAADFSKRPKEVGDLELGFKSSQPGPAQAPGLTSELPAPVAAPRIQVIESQTRPTVTRFRGPWPATAGSGKPPSHVLYVPQSLTQVKTRGSTVFCGTEQIAAPDFIYKAEARRTADDETQVLLWL